MYEEGLVIRFLESPHAEQSYCCIANFIFKHQASNNYENNSGIQTYLSTNQPYN